MSSYALAGRSAVWAVLRDIETGVKVRFAGVHFDDRSEVTRCAQVDALLDYIDPEAPAVIVGDLNAMHGDSGTARIIRLLKPLAARLPVIDPDPANKPPKVARLGSLLSRLVGMADGSTLAAIESAGFDNMSYGNKATMPSRFPFVQLDHVFASGGFLGDDHLVHRDTGLSDHRAISARLDPVECYVPDREY